MDIGTISAILTSVKTASELAKLIKESGATLEEAQRNLQLVDLISALSSVKKHVAEVEQTLRDKDAEIRALKAAAALEVEMEWQPPYYWKRTDSGRDGPYCQQCFDKDRALMRLIEGEKGYWSCRTCKCSYPDSSYSPLQITPLPSTGWVK